MREVDTRETLIREGHRALLASGYDGVGIGPILKAAGVPKGSFYHFFESKEAFALAVLEVHSERYQEARAEFLEDRTIAPLQRIERYFEYLIDLLEREDFGGCLFGNLTLSISARGTSFRQKLRTAFDDWQEDIRAVLVEAQQWNELANGVDPAEAAAFLIDAYEGAIVRCKSEQSVQPLRRFAAMTGRLLQLPE